MYFSILHIPHSSETIPPEIGATFALSDSELKAELLRLTDAHTAELFRLDHSLAKEIVFPWSRLVVDPERFLDDSKEPMSQHGMGAVYTRTTTGQVLRSQLTDEMRENLVSTYFRSHHARLSGLTRDVLSAHRRCLLIDCHSFPSRPFPYETRPLRKRPAICIGTDEFHTPVWLADLAVDLFSARGLAVEKDFPFSGSIVPLEFYRTNPSVLSIMIEVNRSLYMDESDGSRIASFSAIQRRIQDALTELISQAYLHSAGPGET